MAQTKVKQGLIDASLGTEWDSTIQTSNFTAAAGAGYFVNTTSAQITVTLPAGTVGDEIIIQDYAGTFNTNQVIFTANGSEKIQGTTDDHQCIIANATVNLIYQDTAKGWTADNIELPVIVDYLVVAGGGGGGYDDAGGAGAGGLRTSYGSTSGGGSSSENTLNLQVATNYTVTIGAGGAGGQTAAAASGLVPQPGNTSTFDSISSAGGGPGLQLTGTTGGSGSGASGNANETTPGQGTTGQGFDGGNGFARTGGSADEGGGGGGGAGAVGGNASQNTGGDGGAGLAVSITGSSVTYAGGGGGGGVTTGGAGGSGGGAAGTGAANPSAATVNTGGGGGTAGANSGSYTGSNGGSGIVILRYSNVYTLTATGTLVHSTATDGSDKVTTFTAGTGNIQLN